MEYGVNYGAVLVESMNGILRPKGVSKRDHLNQCIKSAIEEDKLDEKWDITASRLLEMLENMSELEAIDLHDRIKLFWELGPHADFSQALVHFGLIPTIRLSADEGGMNPNDIGGQLW